MRKCKVTAETYSDVKRLLNHGETQAKVAEFMNLSKWTVGMIARSTDLDGYYKDCVDIRKKKPEQKVPEKQKPETKEPEELVVSDYKLPGGTLSANYQINRMIRLLEEQNKSLELISNKLAFIVEALT